MYTLVWILVSGAVCFKVGEKYGEDKAKLKYYNYTGENFLDDLGKAFKRRVKGLNFKKYR